MALKLTKEMKKSSYYVWFLGAKEARGLRGVEAIMPALEHLMRREKDTEPHKVTLQVSQKGLKIVQNVVRETGSGKNGKPKLETVKHLLPSDSVAFAHQREDVVVCVLLLMNPVTGWPLHVHAYRCDSLDTARVLHRQLQTLADKPENQKRWREVEAKMMEGEMKEIGRQDSSLGSDAGASSARGSDSGEERSSGGLGSDLPPVRTSILYDSVAAELRARLGGGGGQNRPSSQPLLLPPRDYDTVHRQRGNLQGIELRRCLNTNIVGRVAINPLSNAPNNVVGSTASSGIGSDHASPSPESPQEISGAFGQCDENSTSDEDWNADTAESTMYLMPDVSAEMVFQRPFSQTDLRNSRIFPDNSKQDKYLSPQKSFSRENINSNGYHDSRYPDATRSLEKGKGRFMDNPLNKYAKNFRELEEGHILAKNGNHDFESKREFIRKDFEAKEAERRITERKEIEKRDKRMYEKNDRSRFVADIRENEHKTNKLDARKSGVKAKNEFDEIENRRPKYNFGDDVIGNQEFRTNQRRVPHQQFYQKELQRVDENFSNFRLKEGKSKTELDRENDERYYKPYSEPLRSPEKSYSSRNNPDSCSNNSDTFKRRENIRQRTPSPLDKVSPKDRFKDAKEKFLLMEKERLEQERIRGILEPPISPTRRDRGGYGRDERDTPISPSRNFNNYDKYFDNERYVSEEVVYPKPAPRRQGPHHDVGLHRSAEAPEERYRMGDKHDPKRRSMFNLTEEEHRRTCNEIAKELKRKSYADYNNGLVAYEEEVFREADRAFHELPESDRYTRVDQQHFSRSSVDLDRLGDIKSSIHLDSRFLKNQRGNVRHSYAEPKVKVDRNFNRKHYPDIIQRTNSSLSSNGRVGIASVHPY